MDKYEEALEKAKAYDEALELMRDCVPDENGLVHVRPSDIFSELKESEDEKTRGDIISLVNEFWERIGSINPEYSSRSRMIDWLEKQKFTQKDVDDSWLKGMCYAKDELEKQGEKPTQEIEPFEAEHGKYYYCIKDYFCGGRKQASKGDVVQALRGLPIMGLKDASEYFRPVNFIKCNSAWSEEDDIMVNDILRCLPVKSRPEFNQRRADWIKSFKSRVQSQPKQEWKQENREELTEFENAMMHIGGSFFGENAGLDPNDTDTIKEQAELLLELAPKIEWSEEDEIKIKSIIAFLKSPSLYAMDGNKGIIDANIKYLKSIKDKVQSQSQWKPSSEQLYTLHWLATNVLTDGEVDKKASEILYTLYDDLKKLKGE